MRINRLKNKVMVGRVEIITLLLFPGSLNVSSLTYLFVIMNIFFSSYFSFLSPMSLFVFSFAFCHCKNEDLPSVHFTLTQINGMNQERYLRRYTRSQDVFKVKLKHGKTPPA